MKLDLSARSAGIILELEDQSFGYQHRDEAQG